MSSDGKSLFQSSRNIKVHLKKQTVKEKKLRSKYDVRLVCLHKQVDMTSRRTNEVKSAKRLRNAFLHASVCTSASAELLRGASPWSCGDISDQFLIFTAVKAKVIGAGEHSSGVIRAVNEASRPCLNHNTEL